jgi:hypothetical protein
MSIKDDDIRDAIAGEKERLRPARLEARREHAKRLRQAKKLLERATESEVVKAMRSAGLRDDSPAFQHALKVWRENRS